MAGYVALVFNCWNLFVRLADPIIIAKRSPPAISDQAIGRENRHAQAHHVTIPAAMESNTRAPPGAHPLARLLSELRNTAIS